ncbi:MAG: glycine cleavage system aminomethyltransferase GcvT [Deltaproteobacteria bacterium]|nr:glycine cleavage system aminomethyltransferase GcvT [Deltaproteobacteria bacterium]
MKTPLYHHHLQLNGRMVEFAGWEMPVQYSGVVAEHLAVRQRAGLFDVSHMGEFSFAGPQALALLQYLTTNDVARLAPGQAHYSLILNEQGGIVDDIIVYRQGPEQFLMVVNAGNLEKDWHWVLAHNTNHADVVNRSRETALLALQGPAAAAILQPLTEISLADLRRFHCAEAHIGSVAVTIARTGYTGSPGFELFCRSADAGTLWQTLLEVGGAHGLMPCGLAARDTLRVEMAYPLHGHEITDKTTPFETRLDWVVKMEKGDFFGREALLKQRAAGINRTLVGLQMVDPGIPRDGYTVLVGGKPIGFVTSGTMSPLLKKGIALAMMGIQHSAVGTKVSVDIRGKERQAEIVATPFVTPAT